MTLHQPARRPRLPEDEDKMTAMTVRAQQLRFVDPLPGFPELSDYAFAPIDDRGVLFSLRAADTPDLRLVLTAPDVFFADYRPDVPADIAESLGSADLDVYVVVTIPSGLADATANLRAPVVVARDTSRAAQVILEDDSLPMQQPLLAGA
jgi:flagellar assembly factor FliW